jgi:hypothetical protein
MFDTSLLHTISRHCAGGVGQRNACTLVVCTASVGALTEITSLPSWLKTALVIIPLAS